MPEYQNNNFELDAFSSIGADTLDRPLPKLVPNNPTSSETAFRIGLYFLISNVITISLTVLPVLVKFPDILQGIDRKDWYGVDDLFRLWEPIFVAPFQLLILLESKYFLNSGESAQSHISTWRTIGLTVWFAFGLAIYQQGAGFHSASNLIKNSIVTLRQKPGAVQAYPIIEEIYSWTRDIWQHIISHYMVFH
jgi:hypothetical protein